MATRGGARPGAGRKKGKVSEAKRSLAEMAKEFAEEGLAILAQIARDDGAPAAARVSAVNALHDRGYGKAKQSFDIDARVTTPKTLAEFYGGEES